MPTWAGKPALSAREINVLTRWVTVELHGDRSTHRVIESCSIITTDANEVVGKVHNRMQCTVTGLLKNGQDS